MANLNKIEKLSENIKNIGYKAEIISDATIASVASGLKFAIILHEESIQLRCILSGGFGIPESKLLESANSFNEISRFSKLYTDNDNDFILEVDHLFSDDLASNEEYLRAIIETWEIILDNVKSFIRDNAPGDDES